MSILVSLLIRTSRRRLGGVLAIEGVWSSNAGPTNVSSRNGRDDRRNVEINYKSHLEIVHGEWTQRRKAPKKQEGGHQNFSMSLLHASRVQSW